jgi:hypothetical protein
MGFIQWVNCDILTVSDWWNLDSVVGWVWKISGGWESERQFVISRIYTANDWMDLDGLWLVGLTNYVICGIWQFMIGGI